jgi:hypothetical protein
MSHDRRLKLLDLCLKLAPTLGNMTAFIGQKYDANTIELNDIEKSSMQIAATRCKLDANQVFSV